MAESKKGKPTDLFARAKDAARRELDALRGEPERKPKPRLLTGFGRRFQ